MNEIIKAVLALIASVVGGVCLVYAVAGLATGVVAAVGGVIVGGAYLVPAAVCIAGVAVAASRQGY